MLLLQVASLVIGISLLAPGPVVEATLSGGNSDFFGAGKYIRNVGIIIRWLLLYSRYQSHHHCGHCAWPIRRTMRKQRIVSACLSRRAHARCLLSSYSCFN